jgi:hypothetical protein
MTVEAKWCWKMDYCKKQGIPPAQTWAWEQAEKAFCITHNHHYPRNSDFGYAADSVEEALRADTP